MAGGLAAISGFLVGAGASYLRNAAEEHFKQKQQKEQEEHAQMFNMLNQNPDMGDNKASQDWLKKNAPDLAPGYDALAKQHRQIQGYLSDPDAVNAMMLGRNAGQPQQPGAPQSPPQQQQTPGLKPGTREYWNHRLSVAEPYTGASGDIGRHAKAIVDEAKFQLQELDKQAKPEQAAAEERAKRLADTAPDIVAAETQAGATKERGKKLADLAPDIVGAEVGEAASKSAASASARLGVESSPAGLSAKEKEGEASARGRARGTPPKPVDPEVERKRQIDVATATDKLFKTNNPEPYHFNKHKHLAWQSQHLKALLGAGVDPHVMGWQHGTSKSQGTGWVTADGEFIPDASP